MDVIGILAQKGGVGKTHLGTSWAVEAERAGVSPNPPIHTGGRREDSGRV